MYATQADIEELYGAEALAIVADRDGDGLADAPAVARALEEASQEIDAHVGVAHALPFAVSPPQLRRPAVDIALYRLAGDAGVRTEEHRTRYEDAIALLKRIAEGKARLTLPPDPDAPAPDPDDPFAGAGPRPIVSTGPARLFSRETTRDL